VAAASASVPSQTGYAYDAAGRAVQQIAYSFGAETWETDTTYGGNYVTVVPPATVIWGRTVSLVPFGRPAPSWPKSARTR